MLTPNVLQMSPIGRVGSARSTRARASFQSCLRILDHVVALELGEGGRDVKEQLAGGGVGVCSRNEKNSTLRLLPLFLTLLPLSLTLLPLSCSSS